MNTNNSIFTRVLALMICFIMLVGGLTACFQETDPENNVSTTTTNGGVTTLPTTQPTITTPTTTQPTTTQPTTGTTTGDVVENDPVEDPVDPNVIFSASTTIDASNLILGTLVNDVVIGGEGSTALVPADVMVETNASSLALTLKNVEENDVDLGDVELLNNLDVHISGIAANNTVPMTVALGAILEAGLGATELKLYHIENGTPVLMTRVTSANDFSIHNQYTYNAETGEVTIYVASFSEFVAVQSTASEWEDNTEADISWYNDNDTEFTLEDVADFLGFRNLVDDGVTFEGKTVTLATDIDLKNKLFNPIGYGYADNGGQAFMGTFDGGNHTIYNLYQNGWELGYSNSTAGGGLFASAKNATIKNLAINGANIVMQCIDMGTVVGYAQGKCTFENIIVTNSKLANYQRYTGGVVGEVCKGDGIEDTYTHTFTNITVDSSVKISSLWGDFDNACGGVIGGKWGTARVLMQNVIVAAEIDAFSDVTAAYQWYAYRRCGMLIGHTEQNSPKKALNAAADFLTCVNVNVYYGDWVNYNYYQFTNQSGVNSEGKDVSWQNNYPWVRAEAGEHTGAFSNVRYGNPIIDGQKINTLELAEANKTGFVTITFNQLYGGGQGVYGTNDHEGKGVTIHNNLKKTIFVTSNCTNLKLYYWFANGDDRWTTLIEGIDMSTMLVEGNTYKIELPAYAYGFKIIADEAETEELVLENLESNTVEFNKPCAHEYDNACDATCNECGAEREVGEHVYDNTCDATCNVCNATREVGEHVYDNACDATCNVCNATREVGEHVYDNACDKTCNTCGATRTVGDHKWYNTNYTCTVCGAKAPTKTIYVQNNWLWDDVRIYYYWGAEGSYNDAWPGKAMEPVGYDATNAIEYYKLEIPTYAETFVISGLYNDDNTKRDQTANLDFSNVVTDTVYSCSGRGTGDNYHKVTMTTKALSNCKFDDISNYQLLYFKPSSEWYTDGARFAVYAFKDGSGNKWYSLSDKYSGGIYKVWVSKTYNEIILCRMNPAYTTNSWDNGHVWNKTNDLVIPTNGNNLFTHSGWNATGTWSKYTP